VDAALLSGDGGVDASAAELVVDGSSGGVSVTGVEQDVDASAFSGDLVLTTPAYDPATDTGGVTGQENGAGRDTPAFAVLAGSGNTTVDGADGVSGDRDTVDIEVDVSAATSSSVVTLEGTAEYRVINNGAAVVTLDISAIADDNTVLLEGSGGFELTGTQADVDASDLTGEVQVRTLDDAGPTVINVEAGTGKTTVDAVNANDAITLDAALLLDDGDDVRNTDKDANGNDVTDITEAFVEGSGSVTVNELSADLDASLHTGSLVVNVAQISGIDDVDITLGSSGGEVDVTNSNEGAFIDASSVGSGDVVEIRGIDQAVEVSALGDGVVVDAASDADGYDGALDLVTEVGAQGVEVLTGTAATSLTASGGGSATVEAAELAAALTLSGDSTITVNDLATDLLAGGTAGDVVVNTAAVSGDGASAADAALEMTAGTGRLKVNGDDSVDADTSTVDIAIDATSLADGTLDEDSDGNIETADADLELLGDAEYVITNTNTSSGDEVVVDASALSVSGDVTLEGGGNFNFINTKQDVEAPDLAGRLTVTTADDGSGDAITVTAGRGELGVTTAESGDEITVASANLIDTDTADDELATGVNASGDGFEVTAAGAGAITFNTLYADVDASGLSGDLVATIGSGSPTGFSEDVDIRLGTADATVNTNGYGVTFDAAAAGSGDTLTLNESGDVGVFAAGDGFTVDGSANYSGELTVDSALVANQSMVVRTGSAQATVRGDGAQNSGTIEVDAASLADDTDLVVEGSDEVVVTSLQGDIAGSLGSGTLDVTTIGAADLDIVTGSARTLIDGVGGVVRVDATALAADEVLGAEGAADFTLSAVSGDVDVVADGGFSGAESALSGDLTVNLADGASGVEVFTGTGVTVVDTGTDASGSVSVEADRLGDNVSGDGVDNLTLTGAGSAVVGDVVADTDAGDLDGTLRLTTADNSGDGDIGVILGSSSATLDGTAGDDTLSVTADGMGSAQTLSLTGSSDVVATGLLGNLDADAAGESTLAGTLNLTTGALADGAAIDIILGTSDSVLAIDEVDGAGAGSGSEAVVDAAALVNDKLTLTGDGEVEVDAIARDVDATGLSGDLDIDTGVDVTLRVDAGSGQTQVTSTSDSNVTVDAERIVADGSDTSYELILDGEGTGSSGSVVENLSADLDASDLDGELFVTSSGDASVNVLAGADNTLVNAVGASGDITVDIAQMGAGKRLVAEGSGDVTADAVGSDINVFADGSRPNTTLFEGALTVNLADGASTVDVATGVAATRVEGDLDGNGSGDVAIDAGELGDDTDLTLAGDTRVEVTELVGDVRSDGMSGSLTVTTADNQVDGDITIETSTAATTIDADHADDEVTVEALALGDDALLSVSGDSGFVVKDLVGDLQADAVSSEPAAEAERKLDVTLADVGGASSGGVSIASDRNAIIDAAGASGGLGAEDVLTLSGSGAMRVDNVLADISGGGLGGELVVNTDPLTGVGDIPAMTITTGTASTTVNGVDSQDLPGSGGDSETIDIAVDATALADSDNGTVLSLKGTAEYRLFNNAAANGDKVEVDLSEAGASGRLELRGQGEFDLIETSADIVADLAEGPITVTTRAGAVDTIDVTAGVSGDLTVDAKNSGDVITLEAAATVDDADDAEVDGDDAAGSFIDGNDPTGSGDVYELAAEGSGDVIVEDLAADLDASALGGVLTVELAGSGDFEPGQINDVDILLNADNATVDTLDTGATDVTLDATAMGSGDALTLDGGGDAEVFGLSAGVSVDAKTEVFGGFLDVYTASLGSGDQVSVDTGTDATRISGESGSVSVDAASLSDAVDINGDDDLTLRGTSNFSITALSADVMASGTTGVLEIDTATDAGSGDTAGDEVKVTTGSGDVFVTGAGASGDVLVAAGELGSGDVATLDGEAEFTVEAVGSDVTVDAAAGSEGALTGALAVDLEAGATGVEIFTGASDTTVSGDESAGSGDFTVDATAMVDDAGADRTLDLNGSSNAVVIGLVGAADAADLTGTLTLSSADNNASDDAAVTTGTGVTTLTAFSGDTIAVDAALAPDDQTLTLSGDGAFNVDAFQGDIDAGGGVGALDVDLVDPSGGSASDILIDSDRTTTLKAGLLEEADTLNLAGSGDITVVAETSGSGVADTDGVRTALVDASGTSGAVEINTAPISGSGDSALYGVFDIELSSASGSGVTEFESQAYMKVIAGSGDLTIDGVDDADLNGSGDSDIVDIFVDTADSGGMGGEDVLTLSGSAEYYLDGLEATLRASEDSGDLTGFRNRDDSEQGSSIPVDEANFPVSGDTSGYPPETGGIDSNLNALVTGNMVINGGSGDSVILAGGGDDRIDGGLGNDRLRGADGDDFIIGGSGDDNLFGGDGDDLLFGGSGRDGDDFISGGDGTDAAMFLYSYSSGEVVNGQPTGTITLAYDSSGDITTNSGDAAEVFEYEFTRTSGANGAEVQVNVELTDASGDVVFTDTVLSDVEGLLFVEPDEDPDPTKAQDPNQFSGSVINVDDGVKSPTIQRAVDLADPGDRILVTPETYNEEAFVDKDLEFFIQDGSTGVTLTLDENYTGANPDLKVLSESQVTLNGNSDANEIVVLGKSDFEGVDDSSVAGSLNLTLVQGQDDEGNARDELQLGDFGNIVDFEAASYIINGRGGDDLLAVSPDSTQMNSLRGGGGDDFISGGQARDWLDGGSGADQLISHGGDDRMLGGSGADQLILATRDTEAVNSDGTVYMLTGGGEDDIVVAPLDVSQGIDIDALVFDYTRGVDELDFSELSSDGNPFIDPDVLFDTDGALSGSTIDLGAIAGISGDYVDGSGDAASVGVGGEVELLMVNTGRLTSDDIAPGGDDTWRDAFDTALGLPAV
jgi:hypothetical protein